MPKYAHTKYVYGGHTNVYATKRMRYDPLGYGMSWVRVVLLQALPSWNALLSQTTFIHNYKNQIILHINIDFHYKAMYNYHQLVSVLFSLHDFMSLNQNNDWCLFASRSRLGRRSLESRRLLTHWIVFFRWLDFLTLK